MNHAAGNIEIGLGELVEGVVRHSIAAQEFRLRIGAPRQQAEQQRHHSRGGDPAISLDDFHPEAP